MCVTQMRKQVYYLKVKELLFIGPGGLTIEERVHKVSRSCHSSVNTSV